MARTSRSEGRIQCPSLLLEICSQPEPIPQKHMRSTTETTRPGIVVYVPVKRVPWEPQLQFLLELLQDNRAAHHNSKHQPGPGPTFLKDTDIINSPNTESAPVSE